MSREDGHSEAERGAEDTIVEGTPAELTPEQIAAQRRVEAENIVADRNMDAYEREIYDPEDPQNLQDFRDDTIENRRAEVLGWLRRSRTADVFAGVEDIARNYKELAEFNANAEGLTEEQKKSRQENLDSLRYMLARMYHHKPGLREEINTLLSGEWTRTKEFKERMVLPIEKTWDEINQTLKNSGYERSVPTIAPGKKPVVTLKRTAYAAGALALLIGLYGVSRYLGNKDDERVVAENTLSQKLVAETKAREDGQNTLADGIKKVSDAVDESAKKNQEAYADIKKALAAKGKETEDLIIVERKGTEDVLQKGLAAESAARKDDYNRLAKTIADNNKVTNKKLAELKDVTVKSINALGKKSAADAQRVSDLEKKVNQPGEAVDVKPVTPTVTEPTVKPVVQMQPATERDKAVLKTMEGYLPKAKEDELKEMQKAAGYLRKVDVDQDRLSKLEQGIAARLAKGTAPQPVKVEPKVELQKPAEPKAAGDVTIAFYRKKELSDAEKATYEPALKKATAKIIDPNSKAFQNMLKLGFSAEEAQERLTKGLVGSKEVVYKKGGYTSVVDESGKGVTYKVPRSDVESILNKYGSSSATIPADSPQAKALVGDKMPEGAESVKVYGVNKEAMDKRNEKLKAIQVPGTIVFEGADYRKEIKLTQKTIKKITDLLPKKCAGIEVLADGTVVGNEMIAKGVYNGLLRSEERKQAPNFTKECDKPGEITIKYFPANKK